MRVRSTLGLLLVTVFGVMPAWPQAPAGSQLLVLTNANVIDGVSEHPIRQATVIEPDRGFECDCHSSDGGRFNHLGGAARRRERARQISSGRYDGQQGLSWMPGGKIAYTSRERGVTDIWSMGKDGKDQKQLTAHAATNLYPSATLDGSYIIFTSTRMNASRSIWSIWRMSTDGGNLKQLTTGGPGDRLPKSSPDGRWVVFHSARSGALRAWKVSIDGGEPVPLIDKWTSNPTVSPDGNLIACFYREDQPNAPVKVAVIPLAGGDPVKVLDLPRQSFTSDAGLRWTPDGHALTYIDTINGVSNIWSLPIDGSTPKQLTDFKTDQIFWFDWSRDGKQLALSRGTQTSDVVLIKDFR